MLSGPPHSHHQGQPTPIDPSLGGAGRSAGPLATDGCEARPEVVADRFDHGLDTRTGGSARLGLFDRAALPCSARVAIRRTSFRSDIGGRRKARMPNVSMGSSAARRPSVRDRLSERRRAGNIGRPRHSGNCHCPQLNRSTRGCVEQQSPGDQHRSPHPQAWTRSIAGSTPGSRNAYAPALSVMAAQARIRVNLSQTLLQQLRASFIKASVHSRTDSATRAIPVRDEEKSPFRRGEGAGIGVSLPLAAFRKFDRYVQAASRTLALSHDGAEW